MQTQDYYFRHGGASGFEEVRACFEGFPPFLEIMFVVGGGTVDQILP